MIKLAHAKAVLFALPVWLLLLGWMVPRWAMAAIPSYDQGAKLFNWLSLGLAAGTGVWGGALMLILALATDHRVVGDVLREGLRNAIASPITGMGAYAVIETVRAIGWWGAPFEVSFVLITLAGMGAAPLVGFFQSTATAGAPRVRDGLIDVVIAWLSKLRPSSGDKP